MAKLGIESISLAKVRKIHTSAGHELVVKAGTLVEGENGLAWEDVDGTKSWAPNSAVTAVTG